MSVFIICTYGRILSSSTTITPNALVKTPSMKYKSQTLSLDQWSSESMEYGARLLCRACPLTWKFVLNQFFLWSQMMFIMVAQITWKSGKCLMTNQIEMVICVSFLDISLAKIHKAVPCCLHTIGLLPGWNQSPSHDDNHHDEYNNYDESYFHEWCIALFCEKLLAN